jgi:hypothetical protein
MNLLTGSGFGGVKQCNSEQFKESWRFTIDYLKSEGFIILIYVYNTTW